MLSETWYDEATRLVTAPRPRSEAEARELAEAALRLVHEALTEEVNRRLAGPDVEASTLAELLQNGDSVVLRYVHGEDGYEDEGGGVTEPVREGYRATLHDTEGRQIGEGEAATLVEALAEVRKFEYSNEPPFDLAAQPLSDPGEFPAV